MPIGTGVFLYIDITFSPSLWLSFFGETNFLGYVIVIIIAINNNSE